MINDNYLGGMRCPECGSLRLEGKGGRDFLITGIDAC